MNSASPLERACADCGHRAGRLYRQVRRLLARRQESAAAGREYGREIRDAVGGGRQTARLLAVSAVSGLIVGVATARRR